MTGRAGIGKTATLRVLAAEVGFDILEWTNGVDDPFTEETGKCFILQPVSYC